MFCISFSDLVLVHGESIDIYPKNVTAAEGQNATFLCRINKPTSYCR